MQWLLFIIGGIMALLFVFSQIWRYSDIDCLLCGDTGFDEHGFRCICNSKGNE